MKCKREECTQALTGRQREFCSDKCRMRQSRTKSTSEDAPGSTNPNEPEQIHPLEPEQANPNTPLYVTVDGKCYGRQAVACAEFGTRPEPLDLTDQPVPLNRGRYNRLDGTVYQFDSRGQSFECKYPYKDKHGAHHLAVYETAADAQGACA